MRTVQFFREAYDKVKLDSQLVNKYLNTASRTYDIEYFSLNDSLEADLIKMDLFENGKDFLDAFRELGPFIDPPKRKVIWASSEHASVISALYGQNVKPNQIVGPVKITSDEFLFIKVLDWKSKPLITNQDIQELS